jgi:hypothetical protein
LRLARWRLVPLSLFGLGSKRSVEMMWEEHFRRQKEERERKADKPDGT